MMGGKDSFFLQFPLCSVIYTALLPLHESHDLSFGTFFFLSLHSELILRMSWGAFIILGLLRHQPPSTGSI
ncbi:hypothetical protein BDF14DRAFT_1817833 [Spinellus fusiger]|nr:hypothetical protein BDF14DRAFT_1817833 [Spinellus fusiger]